VALKSGFSDNVEVVVGPVGRAIGRTGLTPNWLTTFGLVLTAAATWAVATGELVLGGLFLIGGGLMDLLDGAVARATGKSTPFGGFYDSVSDRISDGAILAGLAWYLTGEARMFSLTMVALVAAQVTSYVRAKAEGIDLTCSIGFLERGERAVLLVIGLVFHRWALEPVLWLLAVGSTVTVVQRIHHVWCQIDRDIPQDLLELVMADRAWSKAFTRAARRFYGERNFDGAVGDQIRTNGETLGKNGSVTDGRRAEPQRRDEVATGGGPEVPADDRFVADPEAGEPARLDEYEGQPGRSGGRAGEGPGLAP
jgi:CDP-diacylglycerol---glycerol-3-phosphate 3-phosphatidyltransferase